MHSPRPGDDPATKDSLDSTRPGHGPRSTRLGRFLIEERPDANAGRDDHPGSPGPPVVLAYFKSRWGEVDGYLPILHKYRELHPDCRILAILASKDLANSIAEQPFLHNELRQAVDVLIHLPPPPPRAARPAWLRGKMQKIASWYHRKCLRLSWRHVLKYLGHENIQVILKDHRNDDAFLRHLQARFPATCVSAPHGTGIYSVQPDSDVLKQKNIKVDVFLVGDQSEVPCFRKIVGEANSAAIRVVGRSRYDRGWIDYLSKLPGFLDSQEYQRAQASKRTYLYVTRGPSSSFLPTSVYRHLVETTVETTLRDPDSLLLIKPHPSQDLEELKEIMSGFPADRWMISSLQTMQLAHLSDFVVCMISGAILDALAVEKPTVEYFIYTTGEELFLLDGHDKPVSIYTKLGMAIPARTQDELESLILDYFRPGGPSSQWATQRLKAADFLGLDNQSSLRAVEAIDQVSR